LFPTQHQLPWSWVIYGAAIAAYFAGFTLVGSLGPWSAGSENPRVGGSIPPLATTSPSDTRQRLFGGREIDPPIIDALV
jgi:hypothetical protein